MKTFFVFLLLLFTYACTKNKLGGNSTVKGVVAHHERPIANARVFIKFNAKEFPGTDTSKYNDKLSADANGNYSIKCYKGDYYLYAFGYDKASKEFVKGGIPVHIRTNENLEKQLPVTE